MNCLLVRKIFCQHGIFGELYDEDGNFLFYTLEHAYPDGKGGWYPKLNQGTYICVRGKHRLASQPVGTSFTTFEIENVHFADKYVSIRTNILFHAGCFNEDSEGCVLLGLKYSEALKMLKYSKVAFERFMALQKGTNQFTLIVKDQPTK